MNNNQMQIKADDKILKGVYSNIMQIQHTREEFCLDFMSMFAPAGILTARVIISPGHLKRMINAMQSTLNNYEKQFGAISEAKEPEKPKMGFQPS